MAVCAALLSGCGQKGPLYLPPAATAQPAGAPAAPVTITPSVPASVSPTR